MSNSEHPKLGLLARDIQDLSVLSAMLQDAIAPLFDMAYLEKDRAFVAALNRFRWEAAAQEAAGERVHAGLRFDKVNRVQFRNVDRADRDAFVSFLSVVYDEGVVVIHFSDRGAVRLEVDELNCSLRDLDEPWPTIWRPNHPAD